MRNSVSNKQKRANSKMNFRRRRPLIQAYKVCNIMKQDINMRSKKYYLWTGFLND